MRERVFVYLRGTLRDSDSEGVYNIPVGCQTCIYLIRSTLYQSFLKHFWGRDEVIPLYGRGAPAVYYVTGEGMPLELTHLSLSGYFCKDSIMSTR